MIPGIREHGHASLKVNVAKALPIHMRKQVYEISSVRTEPEYRGQGWASELLFSTCTDADIAGKFLMVHVKPDDDSPLDRNRLAEFYSRFGFAPIQAEPLLMVRPCIGRPCK
jgi:predicted GNAT family acetyltransferase